MKRLVVSSMFINSKQQGNEEYRVTVKEQQVNPMTEGKGSLQE